MLEFAAKYQNGKFAKVGETLTDLDGDCWTLVEVQNRKQLRVVPEFGTSTASILVPPYAFGMTITNAIYAVY